MATWHTLARGVCSPTHMGGGCGCDGAGAACEAATPPRPTASRSVGMRAWRGSAYE